MIILSIGLPDINGEDVCQQLRDAGVPTPILMLTSKSQEMDKVMGLEKGADDYIEQSRSVSGSSSRGCAPCCGESAGSSVTWKNMHSGKRWTSRSRRRNSTASRFKLSVREYAVLKYLIMHEGEVVTRDMLLNDVWGSEQFPTTRTVNNYILALRKKLEGKATGSRTYSPCTRPGTSWSRK